MHQGTDTTIDRPSSGSGDRGTKRAPIAAWKLALLALSLLFMITGVVGHVVAGAADTAPPQIEAHEVIGDDGRAAGSSARPPGAVRGLLPGDPMDDGAEGAADAAPAPSDAPTWSPVLFRLGFGFFLGFSIGYALRTFLRISLVSIGFFALLLIGLQYAGVIDVNWGAIAARYDGATAWLSAQTASFRDFIAGHIPFAGSAFAGIAAGFGRRARP